MGRAFNCGIGIIEIVGRTDLEHVVDLDAVREKACQLVPRICGTCVLKDADLGLTKGRCLGLAKGGSYYSFLGGGDVIVGKHLMSILVTDFFARHQGNLMPEGEGGTRSSGPKGKSRL